MKTKQINFTKYYSVHLHDAQIFDISEVMLREWGDHLCNCEWKREREKS